MFEVIGWVFLQIICIGAICWLTLAVYVATGFSGWRKEYLFGILLIGVLGVCSYTLFENAPFTIEHKPLYTQDE